MTNKEFNEFYNNLIQMNEEDLHNTMLEMATLVMNRQKEITKEKQIEMMRIKRERVM